MNDVYDSHVQPFKQITLVSPDHTTYRKQNCTIDHTMNIKQHHVTTEPYVRMYTHYSHAVIG